MWLLFALSTVLFALHANGENEDCDVTKYVKCMEPIHNATFGHPHGLFQNSDDLDDSCPIIKSGIECIKEYAEKCGTEMIAEDFHEQFEKPAGFLLKICDSNSPLRTEYLKSAPCLSESSEDLEICSTKVQEFLAFYDADSSSKELTMGCMYEMMLRACLMSTGAEKCGLDTASFIRKALIYSPSMGMKTCSQE